MKRDARATLLVAILATACADGSPVSGEYCAPTEAGAKCTTISFPAKRGTDTLGTIQLDARRYELRWMDTEAGRRTYIANLPGGSIAFDMTAVDARTVTVRWRDKRPEQTYTLK